MRLPQKFQTAAWLALVALTGVFTAVAGYYTAAAKRMETSVVVAPPPDMTSIEAMFDKKLSPFLRELAEAKRIAEDAKTAADGAVFTANQAKSDAQLVKIMMEKDIVDFRSTLMSVSKDTSRMVGWLEAKGMPGG